MARAGDVRAPSFTPSTDALAWLLASNDPSVRYLALTEILDKPQASREVRRARETISSGARVRALLASQRSDGGFGTHPYQKWTGAHWRLVSLVELGLPAGDRRALDAAEGVLQWLSGRAHRSAIPTIRGRVRRCASQEGNALAACSRLGMAGDPRVRLLAESLVRWQWPDGGWNCDRRPEAQHSSFYESLAPLWGLVEFHRATGNRAAQAAARRTREFFLRHRLFRSCRTGKVINAEWLKLHYPVYWHYDILQALVILSRMGPLRDVRLREALDLVEANRLPNGRWRAGGWYWRPPRRSTSLVDVVSWGRQGPSEMITLNALRVLKAAGRLRRAAA
jgi:hypothetical protein